MNRRSVNGAKKRRKSQPSGTLLIDEAWAVLPEVGRTLSRLGRDYRRRSIPSDFLVGGFETELKFKEATSTAVSRPPEDS